MKNLTLTVGLFAALLISGCIGNDQEKKQNPEASVGEAKDGNLNGKDENLDKATSMGLMKFAMQSDDYATWGQLLNLCSFAKEVQNQQLTLLSPTDAILKKEGRQLLSELKRPENRALLDQVMGMHLLKQNLSLEKLFAMDEVETFNGKFLKIDKEKRTIQGIVVLEKESLTGGGMIIALEDVINYPELELKASAGRNMKKEK